MVASLARQGKVAPVLRYSRGSVTLSRACSVAALAVSFLAARAASAQSPDEIKRAEKTFKEAEKAEKAGDCATAIAKFTEVLKTKETPQVHLRIGVCQEKLGQLADAKTSYEKSLALARAVGNAQVEEYVRGQLAALVARFPKIKIDLGGKAYPDLKIDLDGARLDATTLGTEITVPPGDHLLVAEATGFKRSERTVQVTEKGVVSVKLALTPADATTAPIVAEPPKETPAPAPSPSKAPAIALLVGGAAAIGAGVAFFVVAQGKSSEIDQACGGSDRLACPLSKKDEIDGKVASVDLFHGVSIAAGGVGVVAAAIGVVLLARSPSAPKEPSSAWVRVEPASVPAGGLVRLRGAF